MADAAGEPLPERLAAPADGTVQVWWTPIDTGADALLRTETAVDAGTLARADRMRRDADRRRVVLAHGLLRRLLAAVTGTPPTELVLARHCAACDAHDHGRPYLPGAGVSFGISHGGDIAVVALGAAGACAAVDVELVQPPERWDAVRSHAFSDAEWAATAVGDVAAARTALWARKEAAVKATGHGLSLDLRRVHFAPVGAVLANAEAADGIGDVGAGAMHHSAASVSSAGEAYAITFERGDPPAPPGTWFAADIRLADDHRAAVAVRGEAAPSVHVHRVAL